MDQRKVSVNAAIGAAGDELVAAVRKAEAYRETEAFLAEHRPTVERLRAQTRQFAPALTGPLALGPGRTMGMPWARGGRLL